MASSSLAANTMRSALTMLGIIVGIASVISIIAIGEGGRQEIIGQFNELGASTFLVSVNYGRAASGDYITVEDCEAVKNQLDGVAYCSAPGEVYGNAETLNANRPCIIYGVDIDYISMVNPSVEVGRNFTETEFDDGRPSVMLDTVSAKMIFRNAKNALEQEIEIAIRGRKTTCTIVAVANYPGNAMIESLGIMDDANAPIIMMAPFNTLETLLGRKPRPAGLQVMSEDPDRIDDLAKRVINLLEIRHDNVGDEIYSYRGVANILEKLDNIVDIMTAFISIVAAISLVVGGIGVMNIMLVSVTERTREIGIRKSLGATNRAIAMQFLTESIIITSLGGIAGVAFGIIGAHIPASRVGIEPILDYKPILGALAFSSIIGLFFGLYPAKKAAAMNPIDALRYE